MLELDEHFLQMLLVALKNASFTYMEATEILVDGYVFPNYSTKKWMLDETSVFEFGITETRKWPNLIFRACTKCQRKIRTVFVMRGRFFLNVLRQKLQKLPANLKFRHLVHSVPT